MLKKVHLRLTLLCFAITALILVSLSALCLFISENSLRQNSFASFHSQMNTLLADFETQSVFTRKWLSQIEADGKYIVHITDNDTDFLWGSRELSPARRALIQEVYACYDRSFSSSQAAFPYLNSTADGNDYFACVSVSQRRNGTLSLLILMPLTQLNAQIFRQRCLFVLPVFIAVILLFLFSRYFTGLLLKPVQNSHDAQTAFVASASHELRTPLSVILSAASACREASSAQQEHFFTIIRQEGESMSRLISDLLLLSNADSQQLSVLPVTCEPDTFLLELYESYEPLAEQNRHFLKIFLPAQKITPIQCDVDRIRQVFSILLHNAFSYTPVGSTIRLSLKQQGNRLCFLVADNGPGIPDTQKEHIFERFYRADPACRDGSHFGLGLSIAEKIMESCGGTISVTDTPGGGATFILSLPG